MRMPQRARERADIYGADLIVADCCAAAILFSYLSDVNHVKSDTDRRWCITAGVSPPLSRRLMMEMVWICQKKKKKKRWGSFNIANRTCVSNWPSDSAFTLASDKTLTSQHAPCWAWPADSYIAICAKKLSSVSTSSGLYMLWARDETSTRHPCPKLKITSCRLPRYSNCCMKI